MSSNVVLSVNHMPIELDYFVRRFIDHTVGGMIGALEGIGEIRTLDIAIDGTEVKATLNGADVPVNAFVSKIIRNTVFGMVSSLKGVDDIDRLNLSIERTA